MGQTSGDVLNDDGLNKTDRRLLDLLDEGRVTPTYASDELDVSREYVSERLKRFEEHGHVEKLARGLYELVNDPREVEDGE